MEYFYLKLVFILVVSVVGFAYMMYLQKKKQDYADKQFEIIMAGIAARYEKKKKEIKDAESKTDQDQE